MEQINNLKSVDRITREHLKPNCENCFGFCCTALYFSKQDGFPVDKIAGMPCPNLTSDFRCSVHNKLKETGLKGCIAYECFGAGQQVSQVTFAGRDWRTEPELAASQFEAFRVMQNLHEICWYLLEATSYRLSPSTYKSVSKAFADTQNMTRLAPAALTKLDLSAHHAKIGKLLGVVSQMTRSEISRKNHIAFRPEQRPNSPDYFGKDLRKKDLRCVTLRSACLIAANLEGADLNGTDFLGADLRDTNLKGADLSNSIFLTQSQVNAAIGDSGTKLPKFLSYPSDWAEDIL